jgi:hypothetical protein
MADPVRRAQAQARQRIGRYHRAVRAASDREDWPALEKYVALLDRDIAQLASLTAPPGALVAPDTTANAYTPAATVDWTDDGLILAWAQLRDDPAAQDQIMATLEWREELVAARDAEIAAHEEQQRAERERAWSIVVEGEDAVPSPTPPGDRPAAVARAGMPGGVRLVRPGQLRRGGGRVPGCATEP